MRHNGKFQWQMPKAVGHQEPGNLTLWDRYMGLPSTWNTSGPSIWTISGGGISKKPRAGYLNICSQITQLVRAHRAQMPDISIMVWADISNPLVTTPFLENFHLPT